MTGCTDCGGPISLNTTGRCRKCAGKMLAAWNSTPLPDTSAEAAKAGSRGLLRRQLETGQHFLTSRSAFDAACELARVA